MVTPMLLPCGAHDADRPEPAAAMAAVMQPGLSSTININDFHCSLRYANVKALTETAKQMGIKLTGIQGYYDECTESTTIKRAVPKVVDPSCKSSRSFQRIFINLAGSFPSSTDGAKYIIEVVNDNTNFGWGVFLSDKSSPAVVRAIKT